MKKLKLLAVLSSMVLGLSAQKEYLPTPADLDLFLTTKTYVVLEESPMSDFNFEVREAMKQLWNITSFEFIKNSEFASKSKDPNSSFLYTSIVTFEKDKTDSRYIFLHASLGGPNHGIDDLRDIVSVPLGYYGVDADAYNYKIGVLLVFMQNHIRLMKENPSIVSSNVFKHYNENMADVKDKTLYLIEDELTKEIGTAARIKQIYPYKFKIVTREEVRQAVLDKDESIVFLHKVGPEGKKLDARCYKILIGAGDAKFYYFDYHKVNQKSPDGFLLSDLKKLAGK